MLIGCEQQDASPSGCGATGFPPLTPTGRADRRLDRDHWSFDPGHYRDTHMSVLLEPSAYGVVAMVGVTFVGFIMLLIAAGAR